jgi:hypothetical protein
MHDPGDLARIAAGVPVAALLPWSLPRGSRSPRLGLILSAIYGAVVALPFLPAAAGWVVFAGPPAAVAATARLRTFGDEAKPNTPVLRTALPIVAPALLVAAAGLVALDPPGLWDALRTAVDSNAAVLTASAALAAVFLGGSVVAWVLSPFATILATEESPEKLGSLKHAGTLIGWFERALFFALLAGGAPEAAAVALTAKSVARFPLLSKHEEGFAEYFLIGTLASLAIALVLALSIRGALGLSAF